MRRRPIARAIAAACAVIALRAFAAGDAVRGAALHEACLGCHGTELYMPGRAKDRSLSGLKKEVERWNDRYNPKFTRVQTQDLVAYLNRDFYRFPN